MAAMFERLFLSNKEDRKLEKMEREERALKGRISKLFDDAQGTIDNCEHAIEHQFDKIAKDEITSIDFQVFIDKKADIAKAKYSQDILAQTYAELFDEVLPQLCPRQVTKVSRAAKTTKPAAKPVAKPAKAPRAKKVAVK